MKIKLNGKVVVIILSITFILIALFTSTYALFTNEEESPNVNSYNTGLLSIIATSKSKNISLDSVLPMTDANGILTEPYTFTITNVGNLDYQFNLKLLSIGDAETTISPLYIKVQIDDSETVYNLSEINSILKENVTLKAGESMDVKLRVWLSIETPNSEIGKSFNCKIVTDGEAIYTTSNKEYVVTPYSDFTYVIGSETPVLTSMEYDGKTMLFPDIELDTNEILLLKYIGTDNEVNIPDTYTINGVEYNVSLLSSNSTEYDNEDLITAYETIGRRIGAIISGGEIDYDRVSKTILEDIKNERIKNITFDRIDD